MIYYFGLNFIVYVASGILIGLAFNPIAMHFYLEHYSFSKKEIEEDKIDTFSYYGPWN